MSKAKGIELGRQAAQSESEARWLWGDALIEYGWRPSADGVKSGSLSVVDEFRAALTSEGLDIQTLPERTSLSQYAAAAAAFPGASRDGLGIWVAYEATVACNGKEPRFRGTPQQLIEAVRDANSGDLTVDLLRAFTGKKVSVRKPKGSAETALQYLAPEEQLEAAIDSLKQPEVHEVVKEDREKSDELRAAYMGAQYGVGRDLSGIQIQPLDLRQIDYDELFQDAAAAVVSRLADMNAGRWTPNERSQMYLHFLKRLLAGEVTPDADEIDADEIVAEVERFFAEVGR